MTIVSTKTKKFREELEKLTREELLELIEIQDPKLRAQVHRAEWVFENKLRHLSWRDGTPITSRPLTNRELALIIDEPFYPSEEMTRMGYSLVNQRQIHVAKDAVTWAKDFLGLKPHIFQILILRDPSLKKVLRAGRRLGKTWSMAVLALHYAYITKGGRVLVLTPMKTQGALIYNQVMEFVEGAPALADSVSRNVTSPQFEIQLTNGSTIRFFSTGMKSGGKSDVTRGQEAHVIILDELDYMGDEDLEAIFAMLQSTAENQPDKILIGASTPSGRRSVFWEWCTDVDSEFREFWFPSYCNPQWKSKDERFFRKQYTEMGYRHEIEADWGENAEGVFPRKHVDAAFYNNKWNYTPHPVESKTQFVMGVDWDKFGAGVNMVVLEMFPPNHPNKEMAGKYRLAYRLETIREKYALINAVAKIIELHEIFNFQHIYCDRGYGETQVEMLHKHGVDNPKTGLDTVVKGIIFSESIEVRDPYRMEKVRKEVKPYMVDNLVQFFEKGAIKLPEHDEELYMQIISYIVSRTTQLGRPVFESVDGAGDHALDALMLACLAITQNYGDLLRMDYATKGFIVSNQAFLPTTELSGNPAERAIQEEILVDKYGSLTSAPVVIKRSMTGSRRGRGNRPIKRGMF